MTNTEADEIRESIRHAKAIKADLLDDRKWTEERARLKAAADKAHFALQDHLIRDAARPDKLAEMDTNIRKLELKLEAGYADPIREKLEKMAAIMASLQADLDNKGVK